jgi:hypothetical protein
LTNKARKGSEKPKTKSSGARTKEKERKRAKRAKGNVLKDAQSVIETVVLGNGLVVQHNGANGQVEGAQQVGRGLGQKTLLDDGNGNTRGAQVLLGAKEDDAVVANGHGPRQDVAGHVGDNGRAGVAGRGDKRGRELRELNTVDCLVVTVVDQSRIGRQLADPRGLVGDGCELAGCTAAGVGLLAAVSDQVDLVGAEQALGLLVRLERPTAGHQVVEAQLAVDFGAQRGEQLRALVVVGQALGDELAALTQDPGTDEVVDGGRELASAAGLH